ncbi:MAG TPA: EI24 domain-containing protein [Desulfobulbaceae bacterium]|nr:EI24 domain-containing protein [Desulfobulbaceae bacterium]
MRSLNRQKQWVSFFTSIAFIFRHVRLLGWSALLIAATGLFTWFGYFEAIRFVDGLTGHFFQTAPAAVGILGWLSVKGWVILKYLFLMITRIAAFYLAFLTAYCLTTPGYVFLSGTAEHIYLGRKDRQQTRLSPVTLLVDLWEGIKIGIVGLLVTVIALVVNFIPVVGQALVFLIYVFYSALMFIDYPASNKRWSLGQKMDWVRVNPGRSFRLGIFPALISLIPLINVLFMAVLFPLFTVHTTLNFIAVQNGQVPDRSS